MNPSVANQAYTKIVTRLNAIFVDLFYQSLTLLIPPTQELANSFFSGSPLGVTPRALPSLLSSGDDHDHQLTT
jgi:hypothetical protein